MANTTFSGPVISNNGFVGNITGNVTGNVTGNITGDVFASSQSLSGAGAVNLTDMLTSLTTTGASQALTLANGTVGQLKIITHTVDGGSAILTPTTAIGFTTMTFTNVGDTITLIYTSAGWAIVGNRGGTVA
ncbi:hypothetical protein EBQ81_02925 [bacterium]|nr:hypothetical protein [bacterium]